jgi:hypothetical protein
MRILTIAYIWPCAFYINEVVYIHKLKIDTHIEKFSQVFIDVKDAQKTFGDHLQNWYSWFFKYLTTLNIGLRMCV